MEVIPQDTPAAQSIDWKFNPRQGQALEILSDWEDTKIIELLYGGAKGGGKSVFLTRFLYIYACAVIKIFDMRPSREPLCIGFLGRVRGADFRKTTLESWRTYVDAPYIIKEQAGEIVIGDTVKYHFGGMDDENAINKFNSAEYAVIAIDQAEEMDPKQWGRLKGTLRLKYKGRELPKRLLLTANPAQCFLKSEYVQQKKANPRKVFLQALPGDNNFLDSSYVETLTDSYKNYPELLNAYLHGSWDELEEGSTIIRADWINAAIDRRLPYSTPRIVVSCDPAWTGELADEQVLYVLKNGQEIDRSFVYKKTTWELAARLVWLVNKHGAGAAIIDCIGIGAGVYDETCRLMAPHKVQKFVSSESPEDVPGEREQHEYGNKRAQAWFNAAKMFANGEVSITNDPELIKELSAVRFIIRRGKLFVEDKEDLRQRLGRSPDRADAFIMALWGLQKCEEWQPGTFDTTEPLNTSERSSVASWELAQ